MGFLTLAGPTLALLLNTAASYHRGWRAGSPIDTTVCTLLVVAVLVPCLLILIQRGRLFLTTHMAQVLAMGLSFWGTLALAEVILAIRTPPLASELFHRRKPFAKVVFKPNSDLMPGISGESRITRNSVGVRGPEMPPRPEAYRILCIGGSTTECLYLDDEETWPWILMNRLNAEPNMQKAWVGNAGIIAFTSAQHLRFMQESLLMDQVDCLIVLLGINDFLLGVDPKFLELWQKYRTVERVYPVWHSSRILGLVRDAWHRYAMSNDFFVEDPTGAKLINRRLKRLESPPCRQLPNLDRSLAEYRQQIRRMIDACRSHHIRPVFLTQPVAWDDQLSAAAKSRLWQGGLSNGRYLSVECLRDGMDRYNQALRIECKEAGIECVDLSFMNGQERFFYDDCHYTEAGAAEVARHVAQWFIDHRKATRWAN